MLLAAALRQPAEARAAFLQAACEGHPELRAKLEDLIHESDDVDPFLRPGGALDDPLRDALSAILSKQIGPPAPAEENTVLHPIEPPLRTLGNRFDLLAEIGRGGMGIVYRARDRETGEIVALKILRPEIAGDAAALERFRNELRLARQITHRSVCRTYELHRFDETAAIAMEYVEGESLRQVLRRYGAVSISTGLEWTRQICAALGEAHAREIAHRDLKPENILITRDGTVKVTDFGIARSVRPDATQTGTITGTPAYMSPEQAQRKAVDRRSDIYSLGLVLYEMFTGRPAFEADTPLAVAMKHVDESPPAPRLLEPDLPERIERAILRCLEKDPARRFQSVDDLESALSKKPRAEPVPVGVEVPLPVHLARGQRSDWLLFGLAIAGLLSFFSLFTRTNLVTRSQVHFDRSVLSRIAQEYAERLRAPIAKETDSGGSTSWYEYDAVASRKGADAALEAATERFPFLLWYVEWEGGQRERARIDVDHNGSLWAFSRGFPPGVGIETLSAEEARPVAERAIQDFFNLDPSRLTLETTVAATWEEHPANRFVWTEQGEWYGLEPRYAVVLVGRDIASLDRRPQLPADYVRRPFDSSPTLKYETIPPLIILVTILGFAQRSRVQMGARWRKSAVALVFVLSILALWLFVPLAGVGFMIRLTFVSVGALVAAGVALFTSVGIERSVCKLAPARLSNLVQLFERKAATQSCGLAIVRGTLLGFGLLGLDTAMVWLATSQLGMWLHSRSVVGFGADFIGPLRHLEIAGAVGDTLLMGFVLVPFAIYVTTRVVPRLPLAAVLAAALCAATDIQGSMAAVQPNPLKLVFLFLIYLTLVWVFLRFDVLTLLCTIFTYSLWWQNYRLLILREPIGTTGEWIVFAGWGLIVAAFTAAAFRSPLRAAYQRIAAPFE